MGKFDNLNNSCSSEVILDNFGLFTEIFLYLNNPLRMFELREKDNDTLTSAGFMYTNILNIRGVSV